MSSRRKKMSVNRQPEQAAAAKNENAFLPLALKFLDFFLVPLCIVLLLFEPNFKHGYLDHFEAGQYLSWANCVFDGKIPYKDFFVLHGPLHLYTIVSVLLIFGKSVATLRTFFYFNYLMSFLMIYVLARVVCKNRFFIYLIPFICVVEVSQPFWGPRWDFGRMGMGMIVLVLLMLFLKRGKPGFLYAAGAASCIALLYSLDIGICALAASMVLLAAFACTGPDKRIGVVTGSVARNGMRYAAGFLLILIPVFIFILRFDFGPYLKTATHVLQYHLKAWSHPTEYLSQIYGTKPGFAFILTEAFKALYLPGAVYGAIFLYLASCLIKKRWDKEKTMMLVLLTYGVVSYRSAFRALESTQFQVSLPPLVALVSLFLEKMFNTLRGIYKELGERKALGTASLAVSILIIAVFLASPVYFVTSYKRYYTSFGNWLKYQRIKGYLIAEYVRPVTESESDLVYAKAERIGRIMIPRWEAERLDAVVNYLKKNTAPGEEVFTFPEHGIYNFLADRPVPGRFSMAVFAWTSPEWRSELLDELKAKRPRIILFSDQLSKMAMGIGRSEEVLPEVTGFIKTNYHPVIRFGDMLICERNGASP